MLKVLLVSLLALSFRTTVRNAIISGISPKNVAIINQMSNLTKASIIDIVLSNLAGSRSSKTSEAAIQITAHIQSTIILSFKSNNFMIFTSLFSNYKINSFLSLELLAPPYQRIL